MGKDETTNEQTETVQPEVVADDKPTQVCPACQGTGLFDKAEKGSAAEILCTDCKGSGRIPVTE